MSGHKKNRLKHALRYGDLDLPSAPSDSKGYHNKCCNSFIAVMVKYLKKEEDKQASTSSVTSHQSTSAKDIISVGGILENP